MPHQRLCCKHPQGSKQPRTFQWIGLMENLYIRANVVISTQMYKLPVKFIIIISSSSIISISSEITTNSGSGSLASNTNRVLSCAFLLLGSRTFTLSMAFKASNEAHLQAKLKLPRMLRFKAATDRPSSGSVLELPMFPFSKGDLFPLNQKHEMRRHFTFPKSPDCLSDCLINLLCFDGSNIYFMIFHVGKTPVL